MKKKLTRIAAFMLAAVMFAGTSISTYAMDRSYTYNYDWWGDVQDSPDFYTVCKVFGTADLGLDTAMKAPESMFAIDDRLFVCDTGNNRIIEFKQGENETFELVRYIYGFKGGEEEEEITTFLTPKDVAVSEDGNIFVADYGNNRIIKMDGELNYIMRFDVPVDASLDPNTPFKPKKIVIDTAERVYCIAEGINKGLVKYENDGVFSGFVGANKVTFSWYEYLWKKFSTQAQPDKMEGFVPTEYDNAYMDHEGFIYVCTDGYTEDEWREESAEAVRKLNMMGNDILVRNGEYPIYGDLYIGTAGQYSGPSAFLDVTVLDNDVFVCLDSNRGRLFGYDDQGKLVFAFGGGGNMEGYFRKAYSPTAVEHMGNALYVLDTLDCSITMFITTEFGETVFDAMDQFDEGNYEASEAAWRHAMELNGNYDLAYIGVGRALLRQERYKEAMEYFELKYDAENYSKAYKQYRKEWVEDNIALIVVVLLILIVVPLGIGKVKSIKHEIEIADIFKV